MICEHGSLKRSCLICELTDLLVEAQSNLQQHKDALKAMDKALYTALKEIERLKGLRPARTMEEFARRVHLIEEQSKI